jgi:hypothetical protein
VTTEHLLFELSLHGGTPERVYRRLRPDVDALPWSKLQVPSVTPDESRAMRRGFTEAALEEYASVAQHSMLVHELVRAQVPLDLAAMASTLPVDELAHAEIFARVAAALGGAASLSYDPQKLFPRSPGNDGDALLAACSLALGSCCVFETFSHAQARELIARAPDPFLRALWARVAKDEAKHARFGWLLIDWALPELDEPSSAQLGRVAVHAVASLRARIAALHDVPELAFARGAPLAPFDQKTHAAFAERAIQRRIEAPLRRRSLLPAHFRSCP